MTARPEIDVPSLPTFALEQPQGAPPADAQRLGEILGTLRPLSGKDVERVARHQAKHGLRFGEAAVALDLVGPADVEWALSQQFRYAWSRGTSQFDNPALVMACDPFSAQAEAFRDLRAQLMADARLTRRPLAVVGVETGGGRSHCAANLAIAFSQLGARTLLIDADLRAPQQHRLFGIPSAVGLSELLANRGGPRVLQRVPELPDLQLMVAGSVPPNPLELLQSPNFRRLLAAVGGSFDHVVVDTPAAERGADARVIAGTCGAALVVGQRNRSSLAALQKLITGSTQAGAVIAGLVMTER